MAWLGRITGVGAVAAVLWAGAAGAERLKHPAEPQDGPGDSAARRVEVANNEPARIVSVYVSSSRSHEWGDDLLGDDELDAHGSAVVEFHGPCRVDVRIDFEGGASESRRFVDVCRFPSLVIEPGWTLKPMVGA